MVAVKVIDLAGKIVKEINIDREVLPAQPHHQALFDAVISERAGQRQGTHSTLTKGEVRGGGKKPLPQKHSGNARQGSIRNPHWVGGGVAFGPKPTRNYKIKVNRKVTRLALNSALAIKFNQQAVYFLDENIQLDKPSTKTIVKLFSALKLKQQNTLFVLQPQMINLIKSINNMVRATAKT
jgi:large subunit ribosomal protein L4